MKYLGNGKVKDSYDYSEVIMKRDDFPEKKSSMSEHRQANALGII
ncbi:hypothetical protein [Bacillus gaemokensis]|nr:hypothetical protein [Bacillus gaemokensis]